MMAELRRVSKKYGRRVVLDDVTISVKPGEVLGLVGPNGAGKTTLLRIASGLVAPSTGDVRLRFRSSPGSLRYFGGEHTLPGDVSAARWRGLWEPAATSVPQEKMRILSRHTSARWTRGRSSIAAALSHCPGRALGKSRS